MSIQPTSMELTPCQVLWKPAGATAAVDMGGTEGGVKINIGYDKSPIQADQYGKTVLDNRVSGHKFTVETIILEVNDFQKLNYIFPSASLGGTTPYTGSAPSAFIEWITNIGHSDLSVAGQLTLHPLVRGATSNGDWDWNFWKASPVEVTEMSFSPTKQSGFKVVWNVFPDTSKSPAEFGRMGNTSL